MQFRASLRERLRLYTNVAYRLHLLAVLWGELDTNDIAIAEQLLPSLNLTRTALQS